MNLFPAAVRQSWRAALRRPGFVALAGTTLALGIGACAAVFALVDAVLLAPPPFAQHDRLVVLDKNDYQQWPTISPQQYQLLDGIAGVESLGARFAPKDVNVAGGGDPELVTAWPVDAGLLRTLGVAPAPGRNFSAEEDRPNGPRAALIGHAFWQRHFSGDTAVIGRNVLVDGVATPVVGVLPATFRLGGSPDVLLPLALVPNSRDEATNLVVVARLAPGTSLAAAGAAFDTRLQAHFDEQGFADAHWRPRLSVSPIARNLGATARPVLLLFLGCAACVLLLVAVNLSNLMLLRALARNHDSAVRAALGASTRQLVMPALGEGLLVGGIGALGGLVLAAVALRVARAWLPVGWLAPQATLIGVHTIVLAFAAALLVAVLAVLFGVTRGRGAHVAGELAAGARMGTSVAAQRFGRLLVVAQASLATLLLASSALLAHSLWKLSRVDLGFDAPGVITFRLNPASALYPDTASVQHFAQTLLDRLRAEPGVREAALTTTLPIGQQFNVSMRLPDGSAPNEPPQYRVVSPHSFETFRMPFVAGRGFGESDSAGAEPVAIVNVAFAQRYLGGDAIGQVIKVEDGPDLPMPQMRIVGVVGDVRQFGPQEDAPPIVYVPLAQVPDGLMDLVRRFVPLNAAVRVDGAPAVWFDRLRAILREVDARQGVAGLRLFERDVADATATQRMNAALVGLFATLAVVLAGVGLYSVTAVAVAARRREFGVRAALGAAPSRLLRSVVGRGVADVGIGLAIGLALAMVAARLLDRFLYGVGPADPLALAGVILVLAAVAVVACLLPGHRAARVAPMEVLRSE